MARDVQTVQLLVPLATCATCDTRILDYTPVVEVEGRVYCCGNCLAASRRGATLPVPEQPTCAHCEAPLVDPGPTVDRHGLTFCCYNCAAATLAAA
jgi:hypothetical protein